MTQPRGTCVSCGGQPIRQQRCCGAATNSARQAPWPAKRRIAVAKSKAGTRWGRVSWPASATVLGAAGLDQIKPPKEPAAKIPAKKALGIIGSALVARCCDAASARAVANTARKKTLEHPGPAGRRTGCGVLLSHMCWPSARPTVATKVTFAQKKTCGVSAALLGDAAWPVVHGVMIYGAHCRRPRLYRKQLCRFQGCWPLLGLPQYQRPVRAIMHGDAVL